MRPAGGLPVLGGPWDEKLRLLHAVYRAERAEQEAAVCGDQAERSAAAWAVTEARAAVTEWERDRVGVFLHDLRLAVRHDAAAVWLVLDDVFAAMRESRRAMQQRRK